MIVPFQLLGKMALRYQDYALLLVITIIPPVLAIVGAYRMWASDDLSVLQRELRRAELVAKLKALS